MRTSILLLIPPALVTIWAVSKLWNEKPEIPDTSYVSPKVDEAPHELLKKIERGNTWKVQWLRNRACKAIKQIRQDERTLKHEQRKQVEAILISNSRFYQN